MTQKPLADLEYDRLIHETDKAWLFNFAGKEVWVPKSIGEIDVPQRTITVPYNWAYHKEII